MYKPKCMYWCFIVFAWAYSALSMELHHNDRLNIKILKDSEHGTMESGDNVYLNDGEDYDGRTTTHRGVDTDAMTPVTGKPDCPEGQECFGEDMDDVTEDSSTQATSSYTFPSVLEAFNWKDAYEKAVKADIFKSHENMGQGPDMQMETMGEMIDGGEATETSTADSSDPEASTHTPSDVPSSLLINSTDADTANVSGKPQPRFGCFGGDVCLTCARYALLPDGYPVCCFLCSVFPVVLPNIDDEFICTCDYF